MSEQQFFSEDIMQARQGKTENTVLQIIQRYIPFWPLFVFATGLSLAITFIYLRSEVPIYVASAKVLLKDPNKGVGDSKILDALNIFGDTKIVENEIVVLRSTNLVQQVVRELDLYTSVYNQGRVRTEELYKATSPIWFKTLNTENIYPSGKYFFKVDWNQEQINIDNKTVRFNDSVLLNNTKYKVIPNLEYNKNITGKNYFVLFNSVEGAASSIIGDLKANAISLQSTVIDVRLETPVMQKGIDILTKVFEIYNIKAIEDKNQTAANTLAFIDLRLASVTSQLDSAEKNVQNYRTNNQVIDLSTQSRIYLDNVKDLDKNKSEIGVKLNILNHISSYVNSKGNKPGTVPATQLVDDPMLSGLLGKLSDAEFQLERAKSISGEKSDAVILAEQQVNSLQTGIRENIENIRRNLLSTQQSINSNLGATSSILNQIPQKERGLLDISRQQSIKNSIYTYLLQKKEETELNSASSITDIRMVENAAAYGPIKPVAKNYYTTGLLIGILLSVFIVMIREQFNKRILFRSEIEEKTKIPVIGEIVQIKSNDSIVILDGRRTIIAEQFRSLRTNLSFMALSDDAKTILITSNISGEGKSFISVNLAISYTLTDKKVALLELDLRKPKLSKLLNVSRDPGISNYLVGKIPLENIIKETGIKNLSIISAGAIPPNPSELVLSSKFKEMIAELKTRFDCLIIDSAPVGPVSDSLLLKDYVDTTVFVVRHNKTPKSYIRHINAISEQKIFKNISIVFNGLKPRGIGGSYGYGNYGYGSYNYGYGKGGKGYYSEEDQKVSFVKKIKNLFKA